MSNKTGQFMVLEEINEKMFEGYSDKQREWALFHAMTKVTTVINRIMGLCPAQLQNCNQRFKELEDKICERTKSLEVLIIDQAGMVDKQLTRWQRIGILAGVFIVGLACGLGLLTIPAIREHIPWVFKLAAKAAAI